MGEGGTSQHGSPGWGAQGCQLGSPPASRLHPAPGAFLRRGGTAKVVAGIPAPSLLLPAPRPGWGLGGAPRGSRFTRLGLGEWCWGAGGSPRVAGMEGGRWDGGTQGWVEGQRDGQSQAPRLPLLLCPSAPRRSGQEPPRLRRPPSPQRLGAPILGVPPARPGCTLPEWRDGTGMGRGWDGTRRGRDTDRDGTSLQALGEREKC